MSTKRSALLLIFLAALFLTTVGPAPAASASPRIDVGIRVDVAPPPLRREVVVVRPGRGYFWVPGYWDWSPNGGRYIWVAGAWARPPFRGAVWVGPRWRRGPRGAFFVRGHWRR
jgi:hypothetical protein